jgi:hypothetical protein
MKPGVEEPMRVRLSRAPIFEVLFALGPNLSLLPSDYHWIRLFRSPVK